MYYAYILQSERHPKRLYVGFSSDLKTRISDHNDGKNVSTRTGRPWKLVFYAAFQEKAEALAFEAYLKTSSGKAFTRKRLLPDSLEE
jgi:putative endonuclease